MSCEKSRPNFLMKSSINMSSWFRTVLLLGTVSLCLCAGSDALASSTTTGLPWESPLKKLADSLTGPVAQAICLIAIVIGGLTLIFGGEMGEFAKRTIYIVIVIAFILGASSFIASMFAASGAVV